MHWEVEGSWARREIQTAVASQPFVIGQTFLRNSSLKMTFTVISESIDLSFMNILYICFSPHMVDVIPLTEFVLLTK
jgi:hypothetical protein